MHLHIDSDSMVYAVGFVCQDKDEEGNITVEPIEKVLHSVKMQIKSVLKALPYHKEVTVHLTGKDNFRLSLDPDYKANRKDFEKPVLYDVIRTYLIEQWDAVVSEGYEADDACAMAAHVDEEAVIVSKDKDLLTVPGWHYNPNKPKEGLKWVTEEEAALFFYKQCLMGDSVDNIKGVEYISDRLFKKWKLRRTRDNTCGVATAEGILEGCSSVEEMYDRVLECYIDAEQHRLEGCQTVDVKDGWEGLVEEAAKENLLLQGRLLHMTRELDEEGKPVLWELPK